MNYSLTLVVTLWTAAAIALSMALYAVVQYFLYPDITVWEIMFRHLWHVVVLGGSIYGLCWFCNRYCGPWLDCGRRIADM